MEQNKFEKNIQQKLGGLEIQPSVSVWQNVNMQIEKKSQRRWKVLILFFLILFIFMGGYWLLKFEKNYNSQNQISATNFKMDSAESMKDSRSNQLSLTDKIDTSKRSVCNSKIPSGSNTSLLNNESIYKSTIRKPILFKKGNLKIIMEQGNVAEYEDKKLPAKDQNVNELKNNLSDQKEDVIKNEDQKINLDIAIPEPGKSVQDSMPLVQSEKKSIKKETNLKINSKRAFIVKTEKKWVLGITISGGRSLVGNAPLGINNSNSAYLTSTANAGGGIPAYYTPSTIRNSSSFMGGILVEKKVFGKHQLAVGISYKYYSTLIAVGSRIDSAQTSYNFTTSQNGVNNYRNNFNYLELPVSLKFQLGKSKSLPLYWQVGINISQLISSNALQFKPVLGMYYNDNSLLNKTQIGFSTGVFTTLFSKQRNPVNIGPYFYYCTSRLSNEGLYNNKHFSFIGISAEILFREK